METWRDSFHVRLALVAKQQGYRNRKPKNSWWKQPQDMWREGWREWGQHTWHEVLCLSAWLSRSVKCCESCEQLSSLALPVPAPTGRLDATVPARPARPELPGTEIQVQMEVLNIELASEHIELQKGKGLSLSHARTLQKHNMKVIKRRSSKNDYSAASCTCGAEKIYIYITKDWLQFKGHSFDSSCPSSLDSPHLPEPRKRNKSW